MLSIEALLALVVIYDKSFDGRPWLSSKKPLLSKTASFPL